MCVSIVNSRKKSAQDDITAGQGMFLPCGFCAGYFRERAFAQVGCADYPCGLFAEPAHEPKTAHNGFRYYL